MHLGRTECVRQNLHIVERTAAQPRAKRLQHRLLARKACSETSSAPCAALHGVGAFSGRIDAREEMLLLCRTRHACHADNIAADSQNHDISSIITEKGLLRHAIIPSKFMDTSLPYLLPQ